MTHVLVPPACSHTDFAIADRVERYRRRSVGRQQRVARFMGGVASWVFSDRNGERLPDVLHRHTSAVDDADHGLFRRTDSGKPLRRHLNHVALSLYLIG